MSELVSVIVPIYNVEPYLRRCLDSLAAQTYQNLQIIMVDDCSTDHGPQIAQEYVDQDPERFILIRREKNGGLSAARNTGMDAATGAWLAFVDSDDWVTEDYISSMYEVAQADEADIVMSELYYYYSEQHCVIAHPFANLTTQSSHKEKVALSRPYAVTRLFRRDFVSEAGLRFPTNVWRAAEQGMIIPLLTKTDHISILPKAMYYYYQRSDSNSNKNFKGVDVSFYPISEDNVERNAAPGFEQELEFRAISELLYGMPMIMVRSGRTKKELSQHIDWFKEKYPNWKRNTYLPRMAKAKYVFAHFAANKQFGMLKLLICLWDLKKKLDR